MEFVLTFTKLKPYLQPWLYIFCAQKKLSHWDSTFESDLFFRFKDISLTVVSFIMMEEVCYTDFIFAFQI